MKKILLMTILMLIGCKVWSGEVGLPREEIALPAVEGDYLVCVWDETSEQWLQAHQEYDLSGSYTFQLPTWGKWYWIGLWDTVNEKYVFGKWIGHFITH